jgi:hypothetical protein
MSAPESAVVAPVEEVKQETTPVVVDAKVEEPAVVPEVVSPVVEPETATVEPVATEDSAKPESKAEDEPKKDAPKSPSFLSKLLSNIKIGGGEKKAKSPKKEKKKEEVEATATAEAPKEASATEVPVEVPVVPVEVVETGKEAEPVVAETPAAVPVVVAEEPKETPKAERAMKVSRRLSAKVGDFFKSKPKTEVTTPAKVDEHPPKIDKPEAIAPLENIDTEAAKVEEPAKPVEASVPVVAAAA